jgi:hypothetical protein
MSYVRVKRIHLERLIDREVPVVCLGAIGSQEGGGFEIFEGESIPSELGHGSILSFAGLLPRQSGHFEDAPCIFLRNTVVSRWHCQCIFDNGALD